MKGTLARPFALLAIALATASAFAETWRFAGGVPDGLRARECAKFTAEGMSTTASDLKKQPSGCRMQERYEFPEAFELSAEFIPQATESTVWHDCVLWDDMYVEYAPKWKHGGLQVYFRRKGDVWIAAAHIGYGDMTVTTSGAQATLKPGEPVKFSMNYDANGTILWRLGQAAAMSTVERIGRIASGTEIPTFGDRVGANYRPLEATLVNLGIKPLKHGPMVLRLRSQRLSYERGERNATMELMVSNTLGEVVKDLKLHVTENMGGRQFGKAIDFGEDSLGAHAAKVFTIPIETRFKPGDLDVVTELSVRSSKGEIKTERTIPAKIGPRVNPHRMPVMMWGYNAPDSVLVDLGFTHGSMKVTNVQQLDEALMCGFRKVQQYSWNWDKGPMDIGAETLAAQCAQAEADCRRFGEHPAFGGLLPFSEMRDKSAPPTNGVPEGVTGRTARYRDSIARFSDGIVPEDDPVLKYYRWFWAGGDGWPNFTGSIAEVYHHNLPPNTNRRFLSLWDPAVRCPPIWGSGGAVRYLNQWIYAVPEPMNVAGPLEEMFAMAAGRKDQQVMMMTQLICYRAQIAPSNVVVNPEPMWVKKLPRAGFPTIPPDSFTEATWSMIAKPVKAIAYHGWGTIYDTGEETRYCFTCPETTESLRKMLRKVVAPLGPMLMKLGRKEPTFAVFESATTCFMGGAATWGWKAPAITFAQRARMDPKVIYEDTIMRDGFGDLKVVYAPQCSFLTPEMIRKFENFQKHGGLLIGDEKMLSALKPDIVVPVITFDAPVSDHTEDIEAMEMARREGNVKAREGTLRMKAKMCRDAEELRKALAKRGYRPTTDSSSSEIITYSRCANETPYVVAINDCRTFGDYVGQWGMTMEKGMPYEGEVSIDDPSRKVKAVYELSRGGKAEFTRGQDGKVSVAVKYDTNDGRIFVFLPEAIASVKAEAVFDSGRSDDLVVRFSVLGESGKPIPAVLPVEIKVTDANGEVIDGVDYAAAVDGVCRLRVPVNLNDPEGGYTITCRDRASGMVAHTKAERK